MEDVPKERVGGQKAHVFHNAEIQQRVSISSASEGFHSCRSICFASIMVKYTNKLEINRFALFLLIQG